MDEKDLRSIIEQVLTEMNVSGAKPAEKAAAATQSVLKGTISYLGGH